MRDQSLKKVRGLSVTRQKAAHSHSKEEAMKENLDEFDAGLHLRSTVDPIVTKSKTDHYLSFLVPTKEMVEKGDLG